MSAVELQVRVQAAIDRRAAGGDEVGVQVVVVEHGRVVADAVSGWADPDQGREVTPGTLFWAASTAKGVASAVAHVLVERGELAYDLRAACPPRRTTRRSSSSATSGYPSRWWAGWPASSHRSGRRPRRPHRDHRSTGRSRPASGPTPTTRTAGTSSPPTSPPRAP